MVIGSNTFRKVPTIIQWEDMPLLEVGQFVPAGYTTKFTVYHSDGTRLCVVKGAQIYDTKEGRSAQVRMRYENGLTVCELEGHPILELRRDGAAALKGWAELYAPEGVLIHARDTGVTGILDNGTHLQVGGLTLKDGFWEGHTIGIHVTREGIKLGGSGGKTMRADIGGWTTSATGGASISFIKGEPDSPPPGQNPTNGD